MKITVANPIYDSVFKFMMEDERIARTVLSALLKKEVLTVEMRRHEHPNVTRDNLSMFRIDFAAKVRESDGSERLILIELQKTWLNTETLRFRRYLAAQYNAEENMLKEEEQRCYAMPMVAVYLLGHRVGDIEEPVVYVNHKAFDYDGREVANCDTDPLYQQSHTRQHYSADTFAAWQNQQPPRQGVERVRPNTGSGQKPARYQP